MKLLIVGSRGIENFDLSKYISPDVDIIISGGAQGIDSLAEQYADSHRISKYIIRPDYVRYGRAAPIRRNDLMIDMADEALVIWDGKSTGTKYVLNCVRKKKKPLTLVRVD